MLAVITGASAGIGASFARKLAARGYDLLLIARREDRLKALACDVRDLHLVKAEVMAADLTQLDDLETVAQRVQAAADLALLVNNAGFGTNGYFFETTAASQVQMQMLHVVAATRLTHAALANLFPKAQPGTGVINVSSVAAFGVAPQNVSYNATKAWMNHFTAGLAVELAGRKSPVQVQALCPGFTLSEFHDVMKIDRSRVPRSFWLTADFVVEESLRQFGRKLIVIPGWKYRAIVGLLRLTPAGLMRRLSGTAVRRYREQRS